MECLRMRVKVADFGQNHILVRDGMGQKDRAVPSPAPTKGPLKDQIERVRGLHQEDVEAGYGRVYLPHALAEN